MAAHTLTAWARAVLKALKLPVTAANVDWLIGWAQAEGTKAANNPLASTQKAPGATDFNSHGVKNYRTWAQGIAATVKTLRGYPSIVAGFKTGNIITDSFNNPPALVQAFSVWSGNANKPAAGLAYFNRVKTLAQGGGHGLSASDWTSFSGSDLGNAAASGAKAAVNAVSGGLFGGLESWISGSAAYGFTWLGLVLFAIVLGILGLLKLLGVSPGGVLRSGTKAVAA